MSTTSEHYPGSQIMDPPSAELLDQYETTAETPIPEADFFSSLGYMNLKDFEDQVPSEAADRTKEFWALSRDPVSKSEIIINSEATLEQFRSITPEPLWRLMEQEYDTLLYQANKLGRDEVIVRIGTTFEGGGVAKLVPPCIHFINLKAAEAKDRGLKYVVRASWLVAKPDPRFKTTKKLHNLQQCVLPPDERFTEENQREHIQLGEDNFYAMRQLKEFREATRYFVDDFQLAAMIPLIREFYPNAKVDLRNHINIDPKKQAENGTAQYEIGEHLRKCGVPFVENYFAHPFEGSYPDDAQNVTFLPPPVDELGELCRPTTAEEKQDKREWTNRQVVRQNHIRQMMWATYYNDKYGQDNWPREWAYVDDIEPLNWDRPWDFGHARFDWAKYQHINMELGKRVIDKMIAKGALEEQLPLWPIFGNGATDDTDRNLVWDRMLWFVRTHYAAYKKYMPIVGFEHDYLAENVQIENSAFIIHLARREGFEHLPLQGKLKGKPGIVTDAGGLKLHVDEGKTGHIIEHIDQALPGYVDAEEYVPKGSELDQELDRVAELIAEYHLRANKYAALQENTFNQARIDIVKYGTVANVARILGAFNGEDGMDWEMTKRLKNKGLIQDESELIAA